MVHTRYVDDVLASVANWASAYTLRAVMMLALFIECWAGLKFTYVVLAATVQILTTDSR